MPVSSSVRQLYSITKEEKKIKGAMFSSKKSVSIKDFRESERYEEDISFLKEEVEKYISSRADLSESVKADLRDLKVTTGFRKADVELLLGEPDKIVRIKPTPEHNSDEIWIYKIEKMRAFNVFIIPILFVHESYRLYFKEDILVDIRKDYLHQVIRQSAGPGVNDREEKSAN